jgi:hypothetical protein
MSPGLKGHGLAITTAFEFHHFHTPGPVTLFKGLNTGCDSAAAIYLYDINT